MGKHQQEMQNLQQSYQRDMQNLEQEMQKLQQDMTKLQKTYRTNKTEKEQTYQTNKTKLEQIRQTKKTKFQQRHEKLLEQQTIVQANIDMLENGKQLPSSSNPQSYEPDEYLCPITGEIMIDPVSDNEGISHEREAIEEWLRRGNTTSPFKQPLQLGDLRPNIALRNLIEDCRKKKTKIINIFRSETKSILFVYCVLCVLLGIHNFG